MRAITLGVAASLCLGCSSAEPASDPTCAGAAPYAAAGPYAVGVTTLEVEGLPVEVWYPADQGAVRGKTKAGYDMRAWLPAQARAKIPDRDAPLHEMNAYRDVVVSRAARFPLVVFS